jgi:hypothetical protein
MPYKKMTNPTDGINQTNKQLESVEGQLCCANTNLKAIDASLSTGAAFTLASTPQLDSFGRLRTSSPLTLFDSSHRFADNGLWSTATATSGTSVFNANQGLIDLTVTAASGSSVVRETIKVFSYQPGKSLLVLNTFVMASAKTGLTQRVGYYGTGNGYYLEQVNNTVQFVERSSVTGSVVNTPVLQANWNGDKLDGTGASGLTLDLTKAQILWSDFEWLGVGSVRVGFIINGEYIVCHTFHHANLIASTYITTASLPIRYEIFNTAGTSGSSVLKQICSTVISEGGYELRGLQQAVGTPITSPKALATAGTFYPMVSLRLKPTRLDGIAVATAISIIGNTAANYNWQIIVAGNTTGGSWVSAGSNSCVEYNITGTSFSGGRILASGFFTATASTSVSVDILKAALLGTQLERDGLTGTAYEFSLILTAGTNTETAFASIDWEEVSR